MGAYDCDCINNLEYDRRERKAQLSQEGTTKGATSDTISRQQAIDALCSKCTVDKPETCSTIQKGDNWCEEVHILQKVPTIQTEPAIPLSWIENEIEWLKSLDNTFSEITAIQIFAMVLKWKDEKK